MRMTIRYGIGVLGVFVAAAILGDCLAEYYNAQYSKYEEAFNSDVFLISPYDSIYFNRWVYFKNGKVLHTLQDYRDDLGVDTLQMIINE